MSDTDLDQAERERQFAEYDAGVHGAVEPKGITELVKKLRAAVTFDYTTGTDGYQQSADAMWKAALEAFNWAADVVGATGFQASWAALRFYGEAMHVDGPFAISKLSDALYPQYDLPGRIAEFIAENREWLATKAKKKLVEHASDEYVHPNVRAHWERLARDGAQ